VRPEILTAVFLGNRGFRNAWRCGVG